MDDANRLAALGGIVPPTEIGLRAAADALRRGELVGLPTETVYGLAARGDQANAVSKIFRAKNRPSTNPLILHVANVIAARRCFADNLDSVTQHRLYRLATLWPAPLTLIGPKASHIPEIVTAGGPTVGVRIPDHAVAIELLTRVEFPVAAPSANVANYISPTTAQHVINGLRDALTMVVDGGPCRVGLESTIVLMGDSTTSPRVLRTGAVSVDVLQDCLAEPVDLRLGDSTTPTEVSLAPGQFPKHYSPRTPLRLVATTQTKPNRDGRTLRIHASANAVALDGYADRWTIASEGDWDTIAAGLYETLRRADAGSFDQIEMDLPASPTNSRDRAIHQAILDRLSRACHQPG